MNQTPTYWNGTKGAYDAYFMFWFAKKQRWHISPHIFLDTGEDLLQKVQAGDDRGVAVSIEERRWLEHWMGDWLETQLHIGRLP